MLNNLVKVKKIIAREGEREVVNSSYEDMKQFLESEIRPDFSDRNVLCIKFILTACENFDSNVTDNIDNIDNVNSELEESYWYINPYYVQYFLDKIDGNKDLMPMKSINADVVEYILPNYFLPEILLINPSGFNVNIFDEYDVFYNEFNDQKYDLNNFIEYLQRLTKRIKRTIAQNAKD